jgi:hypothetical protein
MTPKFPGESRTMSRPARLGITFFLLIGLVTLSPGASVWADPPTRATSTPPLALMVWL